MSKVFKTLLKVVTMLTLFTTLSTVSFAQKYSMNLQNVTVKMAVDELQRQFGYSVVIKANQIDMNKTISVKANRLKIEDILGQIFAGQDVSFTVEGKKIQVSKAAKTEKAASAAPKPAPHIVTGRITDQSGEPAIGCGVIPNGKTQNGVIADLDGNYTIEVNPNGYLEFSSIGFQTIREKVGERNRIDIVLMPSSESLDAVMVIGYGSASKRLVSSSIASIKMDDIEKGADIDPIKALQGRVTGISISSSSGIPGSSPRVIVRGVSSISGNSSPLYVVDGIPAESYPNINSADIESMEVLKDASATAIYGSRANSGVILITTKSGRKGATRVSASAYTGGATVAHDIPMANTAEYMYAMGIAIDNYNTQAKQLESLYVPNNLIDYDWMAAVSRKIALKSGANASVSGGSENTRFFVSAGYEGEEGYLKTTGFQKYTGRAKFSHDITKWLELNVNTSIAYAHYDKVEETDGSLKILRAAREEQPWYPATHEDGSWRVMSSGGLARHNPLMIIEEEDYYIDKYQLQGTVSAVFKPFKGFKYTPSISGYGIYDKTIKKLTEFNEERGYKDGWGALTEQKDNSFRFVFDNIVSYDNKWSELTFSALLGHSYEQYEYETFGARSDNYANEAYPSSSFNLITSGTNIYPGSIGYNAYALESYFSRVALNWADRYILNLSFRADGSSRFPENNRFGFFPAGSLAWLVSNEKFFPKNPVVTDLKFRISAGQTGSMNGISNWAAMALIGAGTPYNGSSGMRITQTAQNIRWEKSTKLNFGTDIEFFHGRMNLGTDFFYSYTDGLLYPRPVVATTGYTSLTSNIGSMDNIGVEASLGGRIFEGPFKWTLNGNISWSKNRLISLLDNTDIIVVEDSQLYGGNKHALILGKPVSAWYMLRMDGIYQHDDEVPALLYAKGVRAGDIKYYDKNNDGDINDNDRLYCGKATPDFFGGITSSMSWKGFELNMFLQYSIGGKVFSAWKGCGQEGTESLGLSSGSVTTDEGKTVTQFFNISKKAATEFWKGPGTSNTMPRPILTGLHPGWACDYNILTSTRYLEDASYLRLKNVTLAYNLPDKWIEKAKIAGLRIYATIDNAFTLTKYDGYDPEASMSAGPASAKYATDFGYEPSMRSFIFGLDIKF
ncbi:MAG: TonB-dependent receptor [Bacteroidales bacterium]|nr:TonB-dependent receptor [Bacteroidales bacterium]